MQLLKTFISIHKSVKVRPTKHFFLLLFGIIALFVQAYMHNYNIVYIMMFFLVSVAGTSTYFGMKNLYPLEMAFVSQERFFASQKASFTVALNNSSEYALYDLDVSYEEQHHKLKRIEPNARVHLSFEQSFPRRGRVALQSVEVSSLFALPHERKFRSYDLGSSLLIYAKPEGISLSKAFAKEQKERGDLSDFKAIEKFTQGESLAKLHWASLAKSETLMKKEFSYEEERVSLHFRYEALSGDKESRLSQLTLWVLECEAEARRFRLSLGSELFDSSEEGVDAILKALALY